LVNININLVFIKAGLKMGKEKEMEKWFIIMVEHIKVDG